MSPARSRGRRTRRRCMGTRRIPPLRCRNQKSPGSPGSGSAADWRVSGRQGLTAEPPRSPLSRRVGTASGATYLHPVTWLQTLAGSAGFLDTLSRLQFGCELARTLPRAWRASCGTPQAQPRGRGRRASEETAGFRSGAAQSLRRRNGGGSDLRPACDARRSGRGRLEPGAPDAPGGGAALARFSSFLGQRPAPGRDDRR